MQVYQQFDVDVVPPACIFIKNKTPTQVFSCGFCEFFQHASLLKARIWHLLFLVNFVKFNNLQLYEKRGSSRGGLWWILINFSHCSFTENRSVYIVFRDVFRTVTDMESFAKIVSSITK